MAPTTYRRRSQWLSLEGLEARRRTWCAVHECHRCLLCADSTTSQVSPRKKRRAADEGVDLRKLAREDAREAKRLGDLARQLLARGAEPAVVAAETGIRMNTLHQMRKRLRQQGRLAR